MRSGAPVDDEVIIGCVRTKLRIVADDERDAGPRRALNLGHSFAHAIETATGYARYRHGEAVGLGLLAALRLSGRAELRDEVEELLRDAGLPTTLDGVEPEEILTLTRRDKKRRGGGPVRFVLVDAPGAVDVDAEVDEREALRAVAELAG